MLDAYSYYESPNKEETKKYFITLMVKKYEHKDIEFITTIVDSEVDKYYGDEDRKYSYTGWCTFLVPDLTKLIENQIMLSEET